MLDIHIGCVWVRVGKLGTLKHIVKGGNHFVTC